jgi:hypothetical protein
MGAWPNYSSSLKRRIPKADIVQIFQETQDSRRGTFQLTLTAPLQVKASEARLHNIIGQVWFHLLIGFRSDSIENYVIIAIARNLAFSLDGKDISPDAYGAKGALV